MNLRERLNIYEEINFCFSQLDLASQYKNHGDNGVDIGFGYIKQVESSIKRIERAIKIG
jgi:hypothetical protein